MPPRVCPPPASPLAAGWASHHQAPRPPSAGARVERTTTGARRLLVATTNAGKLREFRSLLDPLGWTVVSPRDLGAEMDVEETGVTFEDNARLKARAHA